MLSPLAPRMMTVSASMPSYMFVWYISTPFFRDKVIAVVNLACVTRLRNQPGVYIGINPCKNQSQIDSPQHYSRVGHVPGLILSGAPAAEMPPERPSPPAGRD